MNIDAVLIELEKRLPELEWKVGALGDTVSTKLLPKGLFQFHHDKTPAACVSEIKADIHALACQSSSSGAAYLAKRIHQKINVLVSLCHKSRRKKQTEEKAHFGVSMMSTRQQWLQTLEKEIVRLSEQQKAIAQTLQTMVAQGKAEALLQVRSELGAIEKRLTLAKELFAKATS